MNTWRGAAGLIRKSELASRDAWEKCFFLLSLTGRQLEQFKADNADVGFGSATRTLEQALERTKANIKWVAENQPLVLQWFKENS